MRWYFAIDAAGAAGEAGRHAKLAVRSARLCPGLEPRLLWHGERGDFTRWMEAHGVSVIDAEPPCLAAMRAAEDAGRFRAHSMGHWLRLAIPRLDEDADRVLYTDCDIAFLRPVDWDAIRPRLFAAGPEFAPDAWNYVNSGVMVMTLAALRSVQDQLESLLAERLAAPDAASLDDQVLLNQAFRGHWDRLDPGLNAKPYWRPDPRAGVLHFHGPKLGALAAILDGSWPWDDPVAAPIGALCDAHRANYAGWLALLAERLQTIDPDEAASLAGLAARLDAARAPSRAHDLSFMRFRLFPDSQDSTETGCA